LGLIRSCEHIVTLCTTSCTLDAMFLTECVLYFKTVIAGFRIKVGLTVGVEMLLRCISICILFLRFISICIVFFNLSRCRCRATFVSLCFCRLDR
jgi:hypothetical protein